MRYSDLLDRMMHKDTDAFLEMTDRYGWSLYAYIRKKHPDKDQADSLYNDAMNGIFAALQNPDCEDPLEALLCAFSDRIPHKTEMRTDLQDQNENLVPPQICCTYAPAACEGNKPKRGFWKNFGFALLVILFLTFLWFLAGILMAMGYIPYLNLGYLWVQETILPALQTLRAFLLNCIQ